VKKKATPPFDPSSQPAVERQHAAEDIAMNRLGGGLSTACEFADEVLK
jgi:hypothetical protein